MKKITLLTSVLLGFAMTSLQAGESVSYKQITQPPPTLFGTGFYGGIDMGANVYQNRGEDRTIGDTNPNSPFFGYSLEIDPKNDVGFFGGLKLGYVFGTGVIRPALEGDFFYNGFRGGADFTLRDPHGNVVGERDVTTWVNTGAFMGNFILRIAPPTWRFQPYAGAGVGIYYAESAGTEVVDPVSGRVAINTGGGKNHADLAWQVVAGSDYFFNPQWSAFIEYKYLDYTSTQIDTNQSRDLGQHLIGAGVRFFFH